MQRYLLGRRALLFVTGTSRRQLSTHYPRYNSDISDFSYRREFKSLYSTIRTAMGAGNSRTLDSPPLGRLSTENTALFICDVQERFRTVIHGFPAVVDVARRMTMAAHELGLPVVITEQYPKALGSTVSEVTEVLQSNEASSPYTNIVAKTDFSMMVPDVKGPLGTELSHVKNILLVGVETHVCILQTAIDLVEMGYHVHILVDGVSSQRVGDRSAALHRLAQQHGHIHIASSEMTLFQMMVNTSHPSFKAVSKIVKGDRPEQLPPM